MAVAHNPFDEAYVRANFSYPQLPYAGSEANSVDASITANDSSTSLVDPLLDKDESTAASHSLARQQSIEDITQAVAHDSSTFPAYEVRQPGQRAMKTVAPIRVPRRSEPGAHDGLRSPATALSSAALTSSFPMPPPRTPASQSGTFCSPSVSGHGHSHQASISSGAGTGSNSPHTQSQRHSPIQELSHVMPRKLLSVPPPTPTYPNSRSSSSLGLYWDGEVSSIRNSGSHPLPTRVLPYYSPDPAAQPLTALHEEPYARHRSYAAELSTPLPSMPASPSYPPRAYSPAGSSDVSRGERAAQSPQSILEGSTMPSPARPSGRPQLHRAGSDLTDERGYHARRRESSGTFGTVFSSSPSIGMNKAISTLGHEDFASIGTRSTTHTRTHSEVSMVSSAGITHELVRRGNVFEARPSSAGLQEASRRLARASLVSSELLRSASSTDALRSVLAEDPAYTVDKEYNSRPPTRMRHSHRYSSGPAPTLASLAEDEDDRNLPHADLDYAHSRRRAHHKSSSKRPGGQAARRISDWGNKSTKSYLSHRSGKSSAHFTVASRAPSLPTLHKPSKRAEIAAKEGTIAFNKLARRASTLGDILDNMPEHRPYVSYPVEDRRDPSYDELSELRYSNQLRKARRKIEVGLPDMWQSHTPMGSVSTGIQEADGISSDMREVHSANDSYHTHLGAVFDERQFRRRKSYPASQMREIMSLQTEKASSSGMYDRSSFSSSGSQEQEDPGKSASKPLSWWQLLPPQKKKKVRLAVILLVGLLVAAAIGAAVPLSKRSSSAGSQCTRSCSNQGTPVNKDGQCFCQCRGNRSGPFCDLDSTCVCPDGSDSCPNRLAKSLVTSANYASTLFAPPVNIARLAASLAQLTGANQQQDCASQTRIIETSNLDPTQYRSRRRWAQAVLLWDAATSEDFRSKTLNDFQASLSYWQWQDSPSFQAQPTFQIATHGYSVDFAYQRVFVAPKVLSELGVTPSTAFRLDNTSSTALEQIGAFAVAASAQRTTALSRLFQEIGSDDEQLTVFRQAVMAAPVYFPFDITRSFGSQSTLSVAIRQRDTGGGFPVPPACSPGLPAEQLAELNRIEGNIFGLPDATRQAEIRFNCPGRPTYGLLNILNLRLPFLDTQRPLAAAVMSKQEGKSRMTFSTGPSLSPLVFDGAINASSLTTASFGHMVAIDNVLFDFLIQLRDVDLIKSVIEYISAGMDTPPSPHSDLWKLSDGLQSIPLIETQLWGNLQFSDIDYVVSGIGQTGGNPLFGTEAGGELRSWAHSNGGNKPIRWSLDAASSQYALDSGSGSAFQEVWDGSRTSSPTAIFANLGASNLLTSY